MTSSTKKLRISAVDREDGHNVLSFLYDLQKKEVQLKENVIITELRRFESRKRIIYCAKCTWVSSESWAMCLMWVFCCGRLKKSAFSPPWTYGKCPVDWCWLTIFLELLKSALMENNFQPKSFLISQPTPSLFFSPLFIVVFMSNGLICYPLHHENHCLTKR